MIKNQLTGGKYFIIETGKSRYSREDILHQLLRQRPVLKKVNSVNECDVILVFCTIYSRAGTDIDAALNELNSCSASKPAIFLVLHHTFDPDKIIPDSSRYVNRMNTLTVDCLVNEDSGLLKCNRNEVALTKIVQRFKPQKQWNFYPIIIIISISFGLILWYISTSE
ncbi:uncharacterized protein LOC143738936 [Siphateles boraxobius]|uniref:uncharacterized protein LOC143738936 n=1 Tax=Siphateles boraxobius TaxID=180520 RepID=UPI00406451AD